MITKQYISVIAIYVVCICLSIAWGYWVFLLCDIEKLIIYLPVLVNLGIFVAAVGCDIARRTPEERENLLNGFRTAKGMIAGCLGWLTSMFSGPPGNVSYTPVNLDNVESAAHRPTSGAVSPAQ